MKLISSSSKALPSVDEVVENRLAEIASDRTDEISSVNVTYIEYINTPKDVVIQGEVIVESIEAGGDTISQSGSFGVGVNKGEIKNVGQVGFMSNNPGGLSVGGSVGGNINNVQGDNNKVVKGDTKMTGDRNINTGGGRYNEQIQGDYYEQSGNFGIGHMSGGEIKEGAKVAGVINEAERQNLAQAAAEIQKLLEQLDKSYPSNTTVGKMAIATETINQIDSDPTLAARILSALKAGGVSAFEQFLNHPAASFVIGALEDWQKSKGA
ncbi:MULTISPECIES: hypothetical protein [unclassified Calothrix]|uniref:hypothetical protein n=1 Tax=unclassified Calothrix TaxID=2619626 RepID=UPI001F54FEE2|nr:MULTISPECIES: hypothetical protein [unclassified Calothrix]